MAHDRTDCSGWVTADPERLRTLATADPLSRTDQAVSRDSEVGSRSLERRSGPIVGTLGTSVTELGPIGTEGP